ncbi:YheC/YheD family endospore coat-associated protein [Paenibacillus senegalimassiliensis]|uniref:YheC/YheD family endospore coat-associated protein n=1 Tax=Paenibacillus senegalimassiliensis TaxID=1737426 RepID=UPI00073F64E0|nr:YheC/YheD family protein [Paenibacillus senegalimassiliensis]
MSQTYVGILLNTGMYRGIPTRRTGQESLSLYEETAREYGLTPCYLRLADIDLSSESCIAYVYNGIDYSKQELPLPQVIHNRALYPRAEAVHKIRKLMAMGITVFNVNNRYGKDTIHRLLWNAPHLRHYLPAAMPLTSRSLSTMMSRYPDLILKPIRGSVGHGIMRLQYREDAGWALIYPSPTGPRDWITTRLRRGELPGWARRRLERVPYLVQERIPLVEYEGRPVDLRVTVQRGIHGDFGITGRFAKVSPKGGFVCNIAKGGEALPAEDVLAQILPAALVPAALSHVEALALATCRYLSDRLPLLADVGLDIGLTPEGRPYFIECNGRDQRYGFRKAGMESIWKDTYRRPMAFARYLLDQPAKGTIAPRKGSAKTT